MQNDIVFFDGVCNLCNNAIQFIIKHERNKILKFASLQSDLANKLLTQELIQETDSIVYLKDGSYYTKSEAIFMIASSLQKPYSWIKIFKFLPRKFTDSVYEYIAKNRYKWFGKRAHCQVPRDFEINRFYE